MDRRSFLAGLAGVALASGFASRSGAQSGARRVPLKVDVQGDNITRIEEYFDASQMPELGTE